MRRNRISNWFQETFQNIVFKVVVLLANWLKHRSEQSWKKVVFNVNYGGPMNPGIAERTPYKPFKSIASEMSHQSGLQSRLVESSNIPIVLPDWAREIQPFLQNQLSDHTRRAYETDIKQFLSFLDGRISSLSLNQLRADHIILYRKYLEEGRLTGKGLEKSTINRKLAVIKSFLNWLRANHVISENPALLVKGFPQSQESSLKGLSDEEVCKILDMPNRNSRSGALHSAILNCLLYLGVRKGELIGLQMGDLDSERGVAVLKVRGKGHRVRILPITAAVQRSFEHYFAVCKRERTEKEAPLFTPTKNPRTSTLSKTLNPNAVTYIVQRYAKKAGILKRISPHSCRATCISNALDRKATHRSVQHLAGWSTPLMIQRYDKRREDLKNSAAFLVDYRPEGPEGGAATA
jgi:integrase/recombinase XerD